MSNEIHLLAHNTNLTDCGLDTAEDELISGCFSTLDHPLSNDAEVYRDSEHRNSIMSTLPNICQICRDDSMEEVL